MAAILSRRNEKSAYTTFRQFRQYCDYSDLSMLFVEWPGLNVANEWLTSHYCIKCLDVGDLSDDENKRLKKGEIEESIEEMATLRIVKQFSVRDTLRLGVEADSRMN